MIRRTLSWLDEVAHWLRVDSAILKRGLIALLSYALLLGGALPLYLRVAAPDWIAEFSARNTQIQRVAFNPFHFLLQIEGLSIAEPDSEDEFVSVELIRLNFDPLGSLFTFNWAFSELSIQGFEGQVMTLPDGQFNFADLLAGNEGQEQQEPAESPNLPAIFIGQLTLTGSSLTYDNQRLNESHRLHINDISFFADDFELDARSNSFSLGFQSVGGGQLKFDGQLTVQPLIIGGQLELEGEQLAAIWPQLSDDFHFDLNSAWLDASLDFNLQQLDESLDFKLTDSALVVEGVRIKEVERDLVELERISVAGVDFSLLEQTVIVDELSISGLAAGMTVSDAGIDLIEILTPASSDPEIEPEIENTGSEPEIEPISSWYIRLENLALNNTSLDITERLAAEEAAWKISSLDMTAGPFAAEFSNAGTVFTETTEYDLVIGINDRGQVSSSGVLQLAEQNIAADLSIKSFPLASLQAYLKPYVSLEVEAGSLELDSQLDVYFGEQFNVRGQGALSVLGFRTIDQLVGDEFLSWGLLSIDEIDFDLAEMRFQTRLIAIDQAFARVEVANDGSTNISGILAASEDESIRLKPEEIQETGIVSEQSPELDLTIGEIRIDNSRAFFADYSLMLPFATGIEAVSGNISPLASGQTAKVAINAKVDRYAPIALNGTLDLLSPVRSMDVSLNLADIQMSALTPYSGTYVGYQIDEGLLSLGLGYQLDDNLLMGDNELKIKQLKFGERTESDKLMNLPIKLAVALLEDANQEIELNLEVEGKIDSPDFNIGGLISQAFSRVIGNIVAAPFAILGSMLGDEDELNQIAFEPGTSDLSVKQQKAIEHLAEAMIRRPKLQLAILGSIDPAVDAMALAKRTLDMQLYQDDIRASLEPVSASDIVDAPELRSAVIDAYESAKQRAATEVLALIQEDTEQSGLDFTDQELQREWYIRLYNSLLNDIKILDKDLQKLAIQRADAVNNELLLNSSLLTERLSLIDNQGEQVKKGAKVFLELGAE